MESQTITNGEVRPCCTSRTFFALVASTPTVTHYRCDAVLANGTVCGRNHYVGHVTPLHVGATPRRMGG